MPVTAKETAAAAQAAATAAAATAAATAAQAATAAASVAADAAAAQARVTQKLDDHVAECGKNYARLTDAVKDVSTEMRAAKDRSIVLLLSILGVILLDFAHAKGFF